MQRLRRIKSARFSRCATASARHRSRSAIHISGRSLRLAKDDKLCKSLELDDGGRQVIGVVESPVKKTVTVSRATKRRGKHQSLSVGLEWQRETQSDNIRVTVCSDEPSRCCWSYMCARDGVCWSGDGANQSKNHQMASGGVEAASNKQTTSAT